MDGQAPPVDPAADPAQQPPVGEDGLPVGEEQKQEELIPEEILKDMKNVWDVFDMSQQNQVEIRWLRQIMRALDFDLAPEELAIVR